MEFCCKFYRSIEFQVVLFGLLLSLSILNGVESDCNYFQNLEAGQTYYVYNPEYPKEYHGENHCIWKMASPYNTKISCSIEMSNINCFQGRLSILFADGEVFNYCGKNTFVLNGTNPTIKFDSQYNSNGRFLCQIQTSNNCNCGWKKVTRIVGGKETGVNEYPMMCGLVNSVDKIIYCGCTIISKEYVITAAHCIDGRNITILGAVVGEHDTTTGRDTNATRLFRLDNCTIHPGFSNLQDAQYAHNDVAVCKIARKIEYNAQVGPVCLPFQHKQDSFAGDIVTVLGWGLLEFTGQKSTTLQEVKLNVITLKNCKEYYSGINYSNMCTFTPGKDTCQMDSGGPLLWQDPTTHKLVLVGITSSGVGCASDTPAVAMRTGAFIDWIVSVTPDAQYCQIE
ncbi:venom serine protease 34-like [Temnothorax curvispinosus]|uniref:Venom serine protease 34-like n=1 Tax=Temnothorax curvispinosus TaxID=300111 RepID=A0A6J1RAU0_9HYME|nr:venom serine protease 34-like [Temnothorax curvispinosus]